MSASSISILLEILFLIFLIAILIYKFRIKSLIKIFISDKLQNIL